LILYQSKVQKKTLRFVGRQDCLIEQHPAASDLPVAIEGM